ncbi:MAG: hypothetical protein JRD04_00975 [Deltaproteobacteria bacterium]|nr:hypothetical protein [Deltaproteobacteria bacterium]
MEQTPAKKTLKEILAAFEAQAGNVSETCRSIGISRTTFYRKFDNSSTFKQGVLDLKESLIDRAESALIRKIDSGDLGAICFLLKCKGKSRGWVESPRIPGKQTPDPKALSILDEFLSGDLSVIEACLAFEKEGIPVSETLQSLLKQAEIDPDDSEETPGLFDEDQMEIDAKKYNEIRAKIEKQQREFVPERREEITKMKEQLKTQDSFSEENLE